MGSSDAPTQPENRRRAAILLVFAAFCISAVSCQSNGPEVDGGPNTHALRLFDEVRLYLGALSPAAREAAMPGVVRVDSVAVAAGDRPPPLGEYDRTTHTVRVAMPEAAGFAERRYWGVAPGPALLDSVLVHEFCHSVVDFVSPGLQTAEEEFIAYVVQFELMDDALRASILQSSLIMALDTFTQINGLTYAALGSDFGIAAYLYHQRHPSTLARVLNGTSWEGMSVYLKPGFWGEN